MQKVILYLAIVASLLAGGCAYSDPEKLTTESSQRILKLRGYNFDEQSFFAAAQARDLIAIDAFIVGGINPNAQDGDGRTVLISAAARGEMDVVSRLLSHNVDINVKDKNGYTALSHAIDAMHDDVEEALLNRPELDANCRGRNGRPALMAYVWRDNKARVEKLLAHGADVNLQDLDGDTALHGAAQTGNVEIMGLLMDKGPNVNAKNKVGGTPLMWAAVFGNDDAARMLLENGADVSLKDEDGVTAAQWAARNKRDSMVALLRSKR
jgi:uncharacterized protein